MYALTLETTYTHHSCQQLGECIGRGQFGSVFRALNLNTGQVVAVKRIALEGRTKNEINDLSNEVMFLQRLSHPTVVKYEGVVRTEHYLNIILECATIADFFPGRANLHKPFTDTSRTAHCCRRSGSSGNCQKVW